MKKINRLRKNHDFQRIINSKKSKVSKHLVVYYLPNKFDKLQVGISISKKFINAVGRNKLRRQVRSIMDQVANYNLAYDVVLIIRKPFMDANYKTQKDSIDKLFKRM